MAERPEDLNLPNAVVSRIIKEALPSGVNVGKDARLAITKAASVFVLYATSCANNNALRGKRKTITVNDVYAALEDMEFESFIEPLKLDLDAHKKSQATKKSKKAAKRAELAKENVEDSERLDEQDGAGDEEAADVSAVDSNTRTAEEEGGAADESMETEASA